MAKVVEKKVDEKKEFKLISKIRFGNVTLNIIENTEDGSKFYKVSKFYKDKDGEYKNSDVFYYEDLYKLLLVLQNFFNENVIIENYDKNN